MGFTPNGNKEIPSGTNTNILIYFNLIMDKNEYLEAVELNTGVE